MQRFYLTDPVPDYNGYVPRRVCIIGWHHRGQRPHRELALIGVLTSLYHGEGGGRRNVYWDRNWNSRTFLTALAGFISCEPLSNSEPSMSCTAITLEYLCHLSGLAHSLTPFYQALQLLIHRQKSCWKSEILKKCIATFKTFKIVLYITQ
jgi:hypothetical protein